MLLRAALFVCGGLLAAGPAAAQPHAPPPPYAEEATVTPDTDVWLERLPGRFRLDGVIHHDEEVVPDNGGTPVSMNEWSQPVQGKADCVDIGDGPGMQCVINLVWPELWRPTGKAQLGGVSDLNPAMILAGIAASSGGIRFLLVDSRGLAHPGSSTLNGDAATTNVACVNSPGVQRCKQLVTLTARADAKTLFLVVSTSVYFQRDKRDRKLFLNAGERPTEWLEELLDVSFSLRREPQTTPGTETSSPAASPGSR